MALKFTVHVYIVQSFIKGHRKSGVISMKHSRDITNRISPLTVEECSFSTCSFISQNIGQENPLNNFELISHA